MPEAAKPATLLANKIANLRSLEDRLRTRGAMVLAIAAFSLTLSVGGYIEDSKNGVDTASRVAQDHDYGQSSSNYANVEANSDISQESRDSTFLQVSGFILDISGGAALGLGVFSLSKARRYGNQADLLEAGIALQTGQNGPSIEPTDVQ